MSSTSSKYPSRERCLGRSEGAKILHVLIMRFIEDPYAVNFGECLEGFDKSVLCETSVHGFSHLMDVLHIPFDRIKDRKKATFVAHFLSDRLIERAKKIDSTLETLKFLLISPSREGFTPLHQVLNWTLDKTQSDELIQELN